MMRIKRLSCINVRLKVVLLAIAVCLCVPFLAGCGGASYKNSEDMSGEEIGFLGYEEAADDVAENTDMEEEETEDAAAEETDGSGAQEEKKDSAQNKILIYEGSVSMDTLEFEDTVRAFKKTVESYGGFLEDEQSYGTGSYYDADSLYGAGRPRTFIATARIPSDAYQDFMAKTEGLGKVTESNSKVINMTRQYGTLKAELEIYEAEYQRYLKMFDEVSDDNAMISIQEKLTELSLDIARTKSEMSVISTDAAYSTVHITISEVAAYKENGAGFPQRLKNVLSDSWEGMLAFFEGLLFFFILHWYKLLLLFLIIFFIVKFVKKYDAKNRQKRQQAMQAYQQRQQKEIKTGETDREKVQAGETDQGKVETGETNHEEVQEEGVKHE